MKYCAYCGKQIEDDAICECQAAIEEQKINTHDSTKKNPFVQGKGNLPKDLKKLVVPVTVVVAVVALIFGILAFNSSTIDLGEYISVHEFYGLNGQGSLSVDIDTDKLYQIIVTDNLKEVDYEYMSDEEFGSAMTAAFVLEEEYSRVLDCIDIDVEPWINLSTGDEVTITATFVNPEDYDFNYRFKTGSITVTVPELKEGTAFDPFAEDVVRVTFSGLDGIGTANLEILTEDGPYAFVKYEMETLYDLRNGDVVTVTATYNELNLEENGYYTPELNEKVYKVEGLNQCIESLESIPDDLIVQCKDDAILRMSDTFDEYDQITKDPCVEAVYFLKAFDSQPGYWDNQTNYILNNSIFVVVSYNRASFLDDYTVHDIYYYPDFAVSDSGEIIYDEEYVDYMGFGRSTLEEVEEWLFDEYSDGMTITEIG